MRPPQIMKALVFALLFAFIPLLAQGQTTRIKYTPFVQGASGLGQEQVYGISQTDAYVDSAWTALNANGGILGVYKVANAHQLQAADSAHFVSGPVAEIGYYASASSIFPFQIGAYCPIKIIKKYLDVTHADTIIVGTVYGDTAMLTGIYVQTDDTAGYTSNAVVKFGTTVGGVNLVSTLTPTLGAVSNTTATLVTPRVVLPPGTNIYMTTTTAAVATSEHLNVVAVITHL